jgi:polysaccharide biosynthesis transport protein
MEFSYLKKILWKLKWYLLVVPVICGALTYFLISLKPKMYVSKAQLATGITDQEKVTLGENNDNWNVIGNKFANFLAFLEAKEILTMIAYKLLINDLESGKPFKVVGNKKLVKNHLVNADLVKILPLLKGKYDSIKVLDKNTASDQLILSALNAYGYDLKSVKKMVSSSRVLTSDFVKIEAKTENQYLSAFVANQFCLEVIRFNNYTETKKFGNSLNFFTELKDQKKKELDNKMDSLQKFKENSNLVNYTIQSESKLTQIANLEENRNEELKKVSSLKSAIAQLKSKIGAAGATAGEDVFQNAKIIALQDKIVKMSQRYYSGNSSNKRLADSIQTLRSDLENRIYLLSKNTDQDDLELKSKQELVAKKLNYEIDLSMAQSNYQIIESLLHNLKSNISNIVSDESKISNLEMQISTARQEYLAIEEKYNQAKNISLNSGGNLRQIEFGQPADEPEPTHILLFTLLSAIVGGLIVSGGGVTLALLDNSIRTADRFEEMTSMKAIGTISKQGSGSLSLNQLVGLFQNNAEEKEMLEQQLRSIRYEVIKNSSKILLFSSLTESQGKSFILFSMAYSLSKNGAKILIIDTNFKNNTLSLLFESHLFQNFMQKMDEGRLLSAESNSFEENDSTPSTILFANNDFVKQTGFANIDIIGSSNSTNSPFEIFNDKDFRKLLQALTQKYDYVFMEGSALNSFSDSKELTDFVDKVVLTINADYVLTKADKLSLKFLMSQGDKFMGAILNKVELSDIK